jgi:hypothetical protein
MSLESSEVVVAGTGHVWRAPLNTAIPTNASTAVTEANWTELGYTTEDGVQFNFDRQTNEIMGWQSYEPLRIVVTSIPKEITATFQQFNQNTLSHALGGGTWSGTSPNFSMVPPTTSFLDQFAYIVEFTDTYTYRWIFYKAQVISAFQFQTSRTDNVKLQATVKVLDPGNAFASAWLFQTSDPNLGDYTQAGS